MRSCGDLQQAVEPGDAGKGRGRIDGLAASRPTGAEMGSGCAMESTAAVPAARPVALANVAPNPTFNLTSPKSAIRVPQERSREPGGSRRPARDAAACASRPNLGAT